MLGDRRNEPARLDKYQTVEIDTIALVSMSSLFALVFGILGIIFYHYGVFI